MDGAVPLSLEEEDLNPDPTETPSHVTELNDDETTEAAGSESRDVVAELPSVIRTGKGRRLRSETESRSSKAAGMFVPFNLGRKRSHTFQEVGVGKEKEEHEDVRGGRGL